MGYWFSLFEFDFVDRGGNGSCCIVEETTALVTRPYIHVEKIFEQKIVG